MDPVRKRTIRLVVALTAAVLLAGALAVTSFSASSEARTPSELASSAKQGERYQLTGRVEKGTYVRRGDLHTFKVQERSGGASVPVTYQGSVPDPFREGREVIITVSKNAQGTFVGEHDTLITKCPSKFTKDEDKQS